jgi:D-alanyl-D-alanine carboxypeptidase
MLKAIAVGVLCASVIAAPAMSQPLRPETAALIDQAMKRSIDGGWVAGGVVAVTESGKPVLARGYGLSNIETGSPVTEDTVFRVGSLTKQFTATAVLLLVQDGKLRIDDPVAKYLPAFPRDDPTTFRQLLTHTAGITDYVGRAFERENMLPHTTDRLVSYVLAAPALHDFPPGTQWRYSSANYVLAGAIVERVSGLPFSQFLKARIFDPLGMTSTALDDGRDVVPHRASGYERMPQGYANARRIDMTVPFAAGAMRSSAKDLLVWMDALTHGRVLDATGYRLMTTQVRLSDGGIPTVALPDGRRQPIGYGMGLLVGGDPANPDIGHNGAIDGFTSRNGHFGRSDIDFVVLLNTSPNEHLPIDGVIAALTSEAAAKTAAAR